MLTRLLGEITQHNYVAFCDFGLSRPSIVGADHDVPCESLQKAVLVLLLIIIIIRGQAAKLQDTYFFPTISYYYYAV